MRKRIVWKTYTAVVSTIVPVQLPDKEPELVVTSVLVSKFSRWLYQ